MGSSSLCWWTQPWKNLPGSCCWAYKWAKAPRLFGEPNYVQGCPMSITWACVVSGLPVNSKRSAVQTVGGWIALVTPSLGACHGLGLFTLQPPGPFLCHVPLQYITHICECLKGVTHLFMSEGKIYKSITNFHIYIFVTLIEKSWK